MPFTNNYCSRSSRSGIFFLSVVLLSLVLLVNVAVARDNTVRSMPSLEKIIPVGATPHTIGNIWVNLFNYGRFGDEDMVTPSMEWPGGSGNMHLFSGALWVAGRDATGTIHCTAGEEDEFFPLLTQARIDSFTAINGSAFATDQYSIVLASANRPDANLVDVDYYLWYDTDIYGRRDFDDDGDGLVDEDPLDFIDNDGGGQINEDFAAVSEEDTYTIYSDLWQSRHNAGESPLGIEVIERTYAWSYSYAQDFVIYDFEVKNVGTSSNADSDDPSIVDPDTPGNLTEVYLAMKYDFDISSLASGEYWYDDLTEYLASDKLSYGYDGDDPEVTGNDAGEGGLSTGYLGIRTLDTSIPDGNGNQGIPASHNWWTIDDDPSSDALKFQYMSNGVYAAVPPAPYDYRYLHAIGPFNLAPGASVRWYAAAGVGRGLGGREDPNPHNTRGSLRDIMAFAQELYDADWLAATPPPAPTVEVSYTEEGYVQLDWSSSASTVENYIDPLSGEADFEGYRVYKSDRSDNTGTRIWLPLASYDVMGDGVGAETGLAYTYLDKEVNRGFTYYYAVTSFDDGLTPIGVLETSRTSNLRVDVASAPTESVDNVAVVPNPYKGSAIWDHVPSFDEQWWSKLQFINLPEGKSTIRIYSLTGDFIIELINDDGDSFENWDLISRRGADISSGVYMFVVEDDKGDTKVGKFVVMR
ncbi:MAG: T9SS type A sorting domain-containing protein [Candidatus Neomarinimicrobiota bacterium]